MPIRSAIRQIEDGGMVTDVPRSSAIFPKHDYA